MKFSKRTSQLAKLYNLEPKDVLFALLVNAGATAAESYAVIYRPPTTNDNQIAVRASNYISQRPNLRKLMDELAADPDNPDTTPTKRGRPRKIEQITPEDLPTLDYTDKDSILKEYAEIASRAEKPSDKLSALNGIATLQRMKQEAKIEEEKRVMFYLPLSYEKADLLLQYFERYFAAK